MKNFILTLFAVIMLSPTSANAQVKTDDSAIKTLNTSNNTDIKEISIDELRSINFTRPTVVEFYGNWCLPSTKQIRVMKLVKKEYNGFVDFYKINIAGKSEYLPQFGGATKKIPYILFIYNSTNGTFFYDNHTGFLPHKDLCKFIDNTINKWQTSNHYGTFANSLSGVTSDNIPGTQIWYLTNDGKPINCFNATIKSHIIDKGFGVITFCDNITRIEKQMFAKNRNLISMVIPNGVISIENEAFRDCNALRYFVMPNTMRKIGDYSFANCFLESQATITMPNSLEALGIGCFSECSQLYEFYGKYSSIDNRCLIADGHLMAFAPKDMKEYVIPNDAVIITDDVFCNCSNLLQITIPESVIKIGTRAFYGCNKLKLVNLPAKIKSIGEQAFAECENLDAIYMPDNIISVGSRVFYNCANLREVRLPKSITVIPNQAFYNCRNIENISIPAGITVIEECAFENCLSLSQVQLPESLTLIGEKAFYGCPLNSVAIPSNIKHIGSWALNHASPVYFIPQTPPSMGSYVFGNYSANLRIYVKNKNLRTYKKAWNHHECYYKNSIFKY